MSEELNKLKILKPWFISADNLIAYRLDLNGNIIVIASKTFINPTELNFTFAWKILDENFLLSYPNIYYSEKFKTRYSSLEETMQAADDELKFYYKLIDDKFSVML